jgi:leader peptidase (prepilin peptidase)/N-methyltransferase
MYPVTTAAGAIAAGGMGLVLGSFLNVVAYRLPRGESLSRPRSRCPGCETPIRPYDNVPVLSWLLLRGRCRDCGMGIAWRYPLVEALTAVLLAIVVIVHGADRDAWLGLAFVLLAVPIAVIDLDHQIIPNRMNALGVVVALAILGVTAPEDIPEHLIAAVAASGFLFVFWFAKPGAMGLGDVKFAFVMGLFLGASVAPALLVALLVGSLVGGAIMARKGVQAGRKTKVPFGPFLVTGGLVGLLLGAPIVDWYVATFF